MCANAYIYIHTPIHRCLASKFSVYYRTLFLFYYTVSFLNTLPKSEIKHTYEVEHRTPWYGPRTIEGKDLDEKLYIKLKH